MDNGIAVDIDYLKSLSMDFAKRMVEYAEAAALKAGHAFNPASSAQVAKVVYGELRSTPTKFTATHLISTDDNELKKVKHPIIRDILRYRGLSKLKGTYVDNFIRSKPDV